MSPIDSPGSRSRRPYASSKKALPSSAESKTKVDVWKIGGFTDPSDQSGSYP